MMADVRIWGLLKLVKVPAYNNQVRVQGIDPGIGDNMDIELWDVTDDPATDAAIWNWNSWLVTEAERDELVALMISLGPANEPGPECQAAYYQSDEPQTGASKTTAPVGGWTPELILADTIRKSDNLKPEGSSFQPDHVGVPDFWFESKHTGADLVTTAGLIDTWGKAIYTQFGQTIPSKKFAFVADRGDGIPEATCDGIDDFMSIAGYVAAANAEFTEFIVARTSKTNTQFMEHGEGRKNRFDPLWPAQEHQDSLLLSETCILKN